MVLKTLRVCSAIAASFQNESMAVIDTNGGDCEQNWGCRSNGTSC